MQLLLYLALLLEELVYHIVLHDLLLHLLNQPALLVVLVLLCLVGSVNILIFQNLLHILLKHTAARKILLLN